MKNKKFETKLKKEEKAENYYDLKTDAVNILSDAIKNQNVPENKVEDLIDEKGKKVDPYHVDKLSKVPAWIKVVFIKFWVAGAICYFFLWGLGIYVTNPLDMLVLTGIGTGIITDLLVNSAFLYFESDKKEYHKYMLLPYPAKKFWTLLINIPFGIIEVYCVYYLYVLANYIIVAIKGLDKTDIPLSVEPLLYGLFFVLVDFVFLFIKNLIVKIYKDALNKVNINSK